MPLNNVLGPPVVGDNVFDRTLDLARIWHRLQSNSTLLLAPRRVGKTSLLHRVRETADEHGVRAVYVSVADRSREIDFIGKLYEEIGKLESGDKAIRATVRRLGRRLPRLRKIEIAKVFSAELADESAGEWQELGDATSCRCSC
jgi:AAA+ ATPase superfamily predicted ATPase